MCASIVCSPLGLFKRMDATAYPQTDRYGIRVCVASSLEILMAPHVHIVEVYSQITLLHGT